MRVSRIIVFLCSVLTFTSAQDNHSLKIGKSSDQLPIEFEDMGPAGVTDMAVYGDTLYSIENSKLHILPLTAGIGRYVRISLERGERAAAVNILSADTVAVVLTRTSSRGVGVLLIATQGGIVLGRIDYHRETGSKDDQVVIRENQSTAYIHRSLYIPVTDTRRLDKDPASFLIVNIASKQWRLQKQADYFGTSYAKGRTIASFCDSAQLFTRVARGEYQARINGVDKKMLVRIERNGEVLNIPFKLDCRMNTLWYWQTVNDSTVVVSGLRLD